MQESKITGSLLNRRNFLRNTGLTGLGLAGATVLAGEFGALDHVPGTSSLRSTKVLADTFTADDIAVLQFALNLEYLEAEFYSYAVTGMSLEQNGVPITGDVGTPGETTGGMQVPFGTSGTKGPVSEIARQLMRDEVNHVKLLRSLLGGYTIAKPAINLAAMGEMGKLSVFLTDARDFEAVGTSAYGGAVTLISSAYLQTAAQIALVEALHTGNLNLLCELNNISVAPVDSMDMTPPPSGTNYFDDSLNQALAIIRTPAEVLSIVYAVGKGGTNSGGGFFPNGVNGTITQA